LALHVFSEVEELASGLERRFHIAHWMAGIGIGNRKVIISVNDDTSLLQNSIRSLSTRRLDIPHKVILITLLKNKKIKLKEIKNNLQL